MIKNIRNLFKLKQENKAIKDRITKNIRTLFELKEKGYYKPVQVDSFRITITLNMNVVVIEIKTYQEKNT